MLFELVFIITLGYCVLSLGVEVNCDFDVHAVLLRTVNFAGGTSQFEFDVAPVPPTVPCVTPNSRGEPDANGCVG